MNCKNMNIRQAKRDYKYYKSQVKNQLKHIANFKRILFSHSLKVTKALCKIMNHKLVGIICISGPPDSTTSTPKKDKKLALMP